MDFPSVTTLFLLHVSPVFDISLFPAASYTTTATAEAVHTDKKKNENHPKPVVR
jgi:hypothetical protein